MFQNVGVYGFTQQQLAVAAWLVAADIGQAQASSTALMFWCLSSTGRLAATVQQLAQCPVVLGLCCTAPSRLGTQHVEIVFDRGRDLFFGPVFADANDAKPEPRQRRNDGRPPPEKLSAVSGPCSGNSFAEGHTGDGLGIAIGAGLRITYRSRGTCRSRGAPEFRAAQLHELIDGSLHGGGFEAGRVETQGPSLPSWWCRGTAEPRDYE